MRRLLSVVILVAAALLLLKGSMDCKCLAVSPETNIRTPAVIADIEVLYVIRPPVSRQEVAIVQVAKGWKGARDGDYLFVLSQTPKNDCYSGPLPKKGAKVRMALTSGENDNSWAEGYLRMHCYFSSPPERTLPPEQLEKIRQNEKKNGPPGVADSFNGGGGNGSGPVIETLEAYRNAWSQLEGDTEREPNSFQSQINLAKFLISWRDYRNALPPLRKAVSLNSNDPEARKLLQELRARLDN